METEGVRYATHSWNPTNYKQKGIYDYDLTKYNNHIDLIFDLNDIPSKVQEILDDIAERAKKEAEEKERIRKATEWQNELKNEWTYLGCANGWDETPEILKKANKDPDADWWSQSEGRCYRKIYSNKYKIYYSEDSSD